jgi:glutathione synthase/RimK-type ligase-like ATP-grasp enzyme
MLVRQRGFDKESNILSKAIENRGIETRLVAWNDPEVDWGESSLSIIRTPHDYFLNVPDFLEWTRRAEEHTTLWNPSGVIEWNSSKRYLVRLQEAGVPVPPTILAEYGSDVKLDILLKDTDWDEIIIKPAVSVGAWGAGRYERGDLEAERQFEDVLRNGYTHVHTRDGKLYNLSPGDVILQQFIPEIMTRGEASLVYFGGEFSHAVKKMPADGEFRVHDVYGGHVLRHEASEEERSVAEMGLEALGAETQYARIDTVLSEDGPLIIEMELIEPRLFFEYYPDTVESYADHVEGYIRG